MEFAPQVASLKRWPLTKEMRLAVPLVVPPRSGKQVDRDPVAVTCTSKPMIACQAHHDAAPVRSQTGARDERSEISRR